MDQERRRTPRYSFIAVAEFIEEESKAKLETRVTELSLHGCYFDMVNTLPEGTPLRVKIFFENEFFEARGKVIYSQPNMGMGVTFLEIPPYAMPVLKKWLLQAMVGSKPL